MNASQLEALIRNISDYPKPGIQFKDITPLLSHPKAIQSAVDLMVKPFLSMGIDVVVATEARGFLFGPSLATYLDAGFVPVRKSGKLPSETISHHYELEYGTDCLEIHNDSIQPGQKVLLVDDLLATGGTIGATRTLVEKLGAEVVGFTFLIELLFLKGKDKIGPGLVHSIIQY
jgi:adenine phosphoribosyltransferase